MNIKTLIDEFVKQTHPSTTPKVYSKNDLIIERERVFWSKTSVSPLGLTNGKYLLVKDYVRFFVSQDLIHAEDDEFQYLEETPEGDREFRIWHCEYISNEIARDIKLASLLTI